MGLLDIGLIGGVITLPVEYSLIFASDLKAGIPIICFGIRRGDLELAIQDSFFDLMAG